MLAGYKQTLASHCQAPSPFFYLKKAQLENRSKSDQLRADPRNLYKQIRITREILNIKERKIEAAEKILQEEETACMQGRSALKDFINASTELDNLKLNKLNQTIQLNFLIIEWFRLTDRLLTGQDKITREKLDLNAINTR